MEETALAAEVSTEMFARSQLSGNNTNSSDCLSAEEQRTLSIAIACASSAASLACILAIVFTLASKGHKKFVHRLTLYLTVATLIEAVMSIFDVLPVHHDGTAVVVRNGFEEICAAFGFLFQVSMLLEKLVIGWIVFHLVLFLVLRCSSSVITWKYEVCGLVVVVTLPFSFNWIPFVDGMYGLSGLFCWIKLSENSNCKYDNLGLTLMFVLFYGPSFAVCLFTFVLLVAIAIAMCKRAMQSENGLCQPSVHLQGLKEVLPLLVYPVFYFVVVVAVMATRLRELTTQAVKHSDSSGLVRDVIISCTRLFIPLVLMLHSSILCCRKKSNSSRQRTVNTMTSYSVPNEFTDQEDTEPLIIRGQGMKLPCKEYKSVFEGSEQ